MPPASIRLKNSALGSAASDTWAYAKVCRSDPCSSQRGSIMLEHLFLCRPLLHAYASYRIKRARLFLSNFQEDPSLNLKKQVLTSPRGLFLILHLFFDSKLRLSWCRRMIEYFTICQAREEQSCSIKIGGLYCDLSIWC